MNKKRLLFPALLLIAIAVFAEESITTLRPNQAITEEAEPPSMANVVNTDIRQERNYPMQPPVIPHKIRNYQVDLNTNKCMSCHSRERTQASQAPMVSVTHFMDRDGNFRAEISPRRYFCLQCHVTQTDSPPMGKNQFKDMYEVIETNKN
ncbi:nitrate reductase cytochrome c-type subunit [Zooshikella ganghwensis]|uniref:nitrate reductase cytochrome c-type subunit n=1 Tax=Zooshikella ganghwensis TaxID=202772 RepID=UPI0003FF5C17|nr:nitrate reductase cytochrome c-type subunit [Zooshikella ganghwensis]